MNQSLRFPIVHFLIGLCFGMQWKVADAQTSTKTPPLPPGFSQKLFSDESGEHPYLVYVPAGYQPDKKWPVVLFLHGAGEKGTDGILPITVGLGTALSTNSTLPFIAVFPQNENVRGQHLKGWQAGSEEAERALKVLSQVEADYSTDSENRVLVGWSMGGYGAWSLAAEKPDHWSRVLALSGGEVKDKPLSLSGLATRNVPVWAIHGKTDSLIPYQNSVELIERLNQEGGDGVATIVDGVGHDVWRYAFADEATLNWLIGKGTSARSEVKALESVEPLPDRSQFYLDQYTRLETLPDMISLRMGNDALKVVSEGISDVIPATALSGKLDDIEREFRSGGETIRVKLSDIEFECTVVGSQLAGISGGRFRTQFELNPLRLKIGSTSLKTGNVTASTGAFHIDIGHRNPVILEVEIQPDIDRSGLVLRPIRQKFSIKDNNWHIQPPVDVSVESDRFSKANIVTGVVGGIYLQKSQIEETVLGVVPSLMKLVEDELKSRETPRLARILWPLPALVPDLSIAPSQVRTDREGLSLVFDMQVRTAKSENHQQRHSHVRPFDVVELESSRKLNFGVTLGAISELGGFAIRDGLAYVNVKDLPTDKLAQLADPEVLKQIFPYEMNLDDTSYVVGLRLVEAFSIHSVSQTGANGKLLIEVNVPHARLEASRPRKEGRLEVDFSMAQRIQLTTVEKNGVPTAIIVDWMPDPKITLIDPPGEGRVNTSKFVGIFKKAWTEWSQSQSGVERPIPQMRFGSAVLELESFLIRDDTAELTFGPMLNSDND